MYGINNNTGSTFTEHYNALRNKSTRNRITSAMKTKTTWDKAGDMANMLKDGFNMMSEIRDWTKGETGGERGMAIGRTIAKLFGG